jgi:acyl-CoA synthetase (AMP-forming)/AMP-acid ligase II
MKNTTLTLLSTTQIAEFYAAGFWQDKTIYSSARAHALARPDTWAIRDRERRLTFSALIDAADLLANDLHNSGVRAGQRVGVWMASRVETAIALLACSRNSYTCCPSLHRDHTVADVVALMERARAAAFIGEVGFGADGKTHDIFDALKELPTLRRVISIDPVGSQNQGSNLLELGPQSGLSSMPPTLPSIDPDRVSYLAFTSGTTGVPKGVMHSDNTLLANARAMAKDWKFNTVSVMYTMSPLSHNLGLGALVTALAMGGELVVHDLPRSASVLDRLIETGATFLFGVPTHAIDLLSELRLRGLSKAGKLEGFRISGASAPREVVAELLDYGVKPQSGYGMTEGCSHHYTLPDDSVQRIIETSGRACSGYEVKIFSAENSDEGVSIGDVGQIGGRGASLMLGYFNDQTETEDSFNASGWFMTGDLGYLDSDGYIVITGRKKDLIIRGGHNIYPARIENLALQHQAVMRAAVLPVPDARLGEKVCLAVMLRPGACADAQDLLKHLDEAGLSRYDMPEYFVELREIPLTASGKIYKRDLVEDIKAGRLIPTAVRMLSTDKETV